MKPDIEFKRYIKGNLSQRKEIIFYSNGTKTWFLNGIYHLENGPAVEWDNGYKEWFLYGNQYKDEKHYQEALKEFKK